MRACYDPDVKESATDLTAASPAIAQKRSVRGPGRRLHGALVQKLGTAIVSGEFAPGQVLSGEVDFAHELDVSRSAYREAIQQLSAKGLVESRPKAGTRVLERHRWNLLDPEVLAWAFAGEADPAFVRDLFELRAAIEPAAAALAAERHTRDDLKIMREALAGMRRHSLATEVGRAADRDFHNAILQATKNDAFRFLGASMGAAVAWTTQFKQRQRDLPRNPIPDHSAVLDAIARRDAAGASAAMRQLVDLALEDTQESLEPRT